MPTSGVFTVLISHNLSSNLTVTPLKIKTLFIFCLDLINSVIALIKAFLLLNFLPIEVITLFNVKIIANVEPLLSMLIIYIIVI